MPTGKWKVRKGEFVRAVSSFRSWVTPDGGAGPSGEAGFVAEPGRYHLYVGLACPWAHRTLIVRKLKGLEDIVDVSVVHPVMPSESWVFGDYPGATPDKVLGSRYMAEVYQKADPSFDGLVTVPVLWDRQAETIVNNESSEIIRMFNSAFNAYAGNPDLDLYPAALQADIDELNGFVYENVNNGVYRAGFATSQQAYEAAIERLFGALDKLEHRLAGTRYLLGSQITEADWRLFTTVVRFDAVYHGHFKTNRRRLVDYPNLWGWTRELYQLPGIAETVNMDHIKTHYYMSHTSINPTRIVPTGPELDFMQPHDRDQFEQE